MIIFYLFFIFLAFVIGYFFLMRIQGRLKQGEQLVYKENKVRCIMKAPLAYHCFTRNIEITNRRIIEKSLGFCVQMVILNPSIKRKFSIINVLHVDTAKVATDEKGQECLELVCKHSNITKYFTIRYYLKDFSKVKEQFKQ